MDSVMFGWLDYVIFLLSLSVPVLIGIYFGFFKKKQNSTKEYLYGIGQMTAIPIGISLYSSSTSAVLILGIPSEVYVFGGQFLLAPIGFVLSLIVTWICILPVFCGTLKFSSPYEYIELRFNYPVRVLTTAIYVLHTIMYMPIALYACTLTFSEATGIPIVTCIVVIGGLCVFYTTVGGFTSVIWADTLQGILMFAACLFILYSAVIQAGGVTEVWQRSQDGQRLNVLNLNMSPFIRLSTSSLIIGKCIWQTGHTGCQASALQRYMALPSEKHARIGSLISTAATSIAVLISCVSGLSMYAYFYDCDPVISEKITAYNKLTSYFIAQAVNNTPGFFGFFTAGLLSAGLSTISAEMNTVGGLIYHDIIVRLYKQPISTSRATLIVKIIVCLNGLFYLVAAPYVHRVKYLVQMALMIAGITFGVKAGVILLGTTFPKCNVKGVICGMIAGLGIVSWISIGGMQYDLNSEYVLPMSTENCAPLSNSTDLNNNTVYTNNLTTFSTILQPSAVVEPFILYKLSYMYQPVLGFVTTLAVAMCVSYLTGWNDVNKMDPRLIIPCVQPRRECPVYELNERNQH